MVIYVELDKDLEKKLRVKAVEKFGGQRGPLNKAVEEAVKLWLKT